MINVRFNCGHFNKGSFEKFARFWVARRAAEFVEGDVTVSFFVIFRRNLAEKMDENAAARLTVLFIRNAGTSFEGDNALSKSVFFARNGFEGAALGADASKVIWAERGAVGGVEALADMGKSLAACGDLGAFVGGNAEISKVLGVDAVVCEMFGSAPNASVARADEFYINAEIPAGGEIIINSEDFTVVMVKDGVKENIVHLVNGVWPALGRDAKRIAVGTGGGDVDGRIRFRERFV